MTSRAEQLSRWNDEMMLWLLGQRDLGVPARTIAAKIGKRGQYVTTATNRIADEDVRAEPDAASAYPWRFGIARIAERARRETKA